MLCKLEHLPSGNIVSFELCCHGSLINSTTYDWYASKKDHRKKFVIKKCGIRIDSRGLPGLFLPMGIRFSLAWNAHCIALHFRFYSSTLTSSSSLFQSWQLEKWKWNCTQFIPSLSWVWRFIQTLAKIRNVARFSLLFYKYYMSPLLITNWKLTHQQFHQMKL